MVRTFHLTPLNHQLAVGRLPWSEASLDKAEGARTRVRRLKRKAMGNLRELVKGAPRPLEGALVSCMEHLHTLQYEDRPDYRMCKGYFKEALQQLGATHSPGVPITRETPFEWEAHERWNGPRDEDGGKAGGMVGGKIKPPPSAARIKPPPKAASKEAPPPPATTT